VLSGIFEVLLPRKAGVSLRANHLLLYIFIDI
jgi:hypothetical protein